MTSKHLYIPIKNIDLRINLPASKSISNRALMLNALSYSPYDTKNLSDSDDTRAMFSALESNDNAFDIGAAGTTMRFLTAFLSKTVGEWKITGNERMKQRPIKILVDAINRLGGRIEYLEKEGFPPLRIFGSALVGGKIELDGGVSSQYISALMMIAPYMQKGLKIEFSGNVISKPYIEMTRKMMCDFGVDAGFTDNIIDIRPQTYTPVRFRIESDWSAASYWYEILAIAGKGKIFLSGLKKDSYQGDSKVAELFENLGVKTTYLSDGIEISATENRISKLNYDFTNEPDLAQTFVVTCCMKGIPFRFTGLQSLRIKETDRIAALINETKKLGFVLKSENDNSLIWDGTYHEKADEIVINTYDDHRMAMAFAPCALKQEITINNPEVVSKSYPLFWADYVKISNN